MASLDLRQRRAQQSRIPHTITVQDENTGEDVTFRLPARLRTRMLIDLGKLASAADDGSQLSPAMAAELMEKVFRGIFGEEAERAMDLIDSDELEPIMDLYGVTAGESSASLAS